MADGAATDKITALGILNGRMAHLATVVGNMMYMVGGYCSNNESTGRGKDKDVAVAMKDVYLYSLREVNKTCFYCCFVVLPHGC